MKITQCDPGSCVPRSCTPRMRIKPAKIASQPTGHQTLADLNREPVDGADAEKFATLNEHMKHLHDIAAHLADSP